MPVVIPQNNSIVFANAGPKRPIPDNPTGVIGAASMSEGFPSITMQPLASGGKPPSGQDFNGIFNYLSGHQVFLNAGGVYKFDSAISTAIGGYSKGFVVLLDDELSSVQSTVDANTTNPNSSMVGWQPYGGKLVTDAIPTMSSLIDLIVPIGITLDFAGSQDPNVIYPGTTWERFAPGQFLAGVTDDEDYPEEMQTVGDTGGSLTQALTGANNGPHQHGQRVSSSGTTNNPQSDVTDTSDPVTNTSTGQTDGVATSAYGQLFTDSQGTGQPFSILPPFRTVGRWERTA